VIQHPHVTIIRNEKLSEDLFKIVFRSKGLASGLRPGNFVHIRVSQEMDPLFRRAMSIYSSENDTFSVLFRAMGKGTGLLSKTREGDTVDILGPLGNSFDLPEEDETVILVAGGTGVPPLHFLAHWLLSNCGFDGQQILFLCGISSADDLPLAEAVKHLGIQMRTSSDDGSVGFRGYVSELLKIEVSSYNIKKLRLYTCGPAPMLREISKICADQGIRCQVSLEGHMPCGIGTCLGCVVQSTRGRDEFDRICKEGPVFDSNEVLI
jgi:dihydroorotate dehydrogenase electron transfer subunit